MADKKKDNLSGFEVAPIDYSKLSAGELFTGAFSRGIEGLKGTAFDLVPALAGSLTGHDKYAQEQMQEYQNRMTAAEEANPTAYKELSDIRGIGDIPGFVAETAGMLAPDALAFMTGTGAGATVGRIAAKKAAEKVLERSALEYATKKGLTGEAADTAVETFKNKAIGQSLIDNAAAHGAKLGTNIGLTSTSMAINVPDVLQSVYQDTGEIHPGIALTVGPLIGILDTLFPAHLVKQLGPSGKKILAKELLDKSTVVPTTWKKAFAAELLKDVSMESLTEGTQQALQVAASQMAGDKKKFFDPKNVDSIIMASVQGAVGGVGGGAIPSAIEARNIKAQSQLDAERQKADANIKSDQAIGPAKPIAQTQTEMFGEQAPATPYNARQDQVVTPRQEDIAAQQQAEAMQQNPTAGSPRFYQNQRVATPQIEQQSLGLQGGMTAEQQATAQRDQQNQEMNQLYIDEAQQQREESIQKATTAKHLLDEAIADSDARVAQGDIKRREAARLDLLHPVLENTSIKDTTAAFQGNLKRAGYASLELTPHEKELIQKADDVKAALAEHEAIPPVVEEPSAPNELTAETTGIKEKAEKGPAGTPQPKQLTLFGGEPRTAPEVTEAEAPAPAPKTILDEEALSTAGLPKQSGFYRQLLNKDMANPEHQVAIGQTLAAIRSNTKLSPATKQAVERIANQAFNALATQQEMFDNRGRIKKGVGDGRVHPGLIPKPSRTSTEVPSKPVSNVPASGVKASERPRVGTATAPTAVSGTGKTKKRGALNESKTKAAVTNDNLQAPFVQELEEQGTTTDPETARTLKNRIAELNDRYNQTEDRDEKQSIRDEIVDIRTELSDLGGQYRNVEPTEEFKASKEEIFKVLRETLNSMGLHGIPLRLWNMPEGKGGSYEGKGKNRSLAKIITIALGQSAKGLFESLHHEVIHALKDLNVFTPQEWKMLEDMADKKWIKQYNIKERWTKENGKAPTLEEMREEAIAEAFADYATQPKSTQNIINKIKNFFRAVASAFSSVGFNKPEDVFKDILAGKRTPMKGSWYTTQAKFDEALSKLGHTSDENSQYRNVVKNSKAAYSLIDRMVMSLPLLNDTQQNALSNGITTSKDAVASAVNALLPLHALINSAKPVFGKLVTNFGDLVRQKTGFEGKLIEGIDGVKQILRIALKAAPEQKSDYTKIVNDSTIKEVDPSEQSNREKYKNDPDKLKAFDELRSRYIKLDSTWKRSYVAMRDAYKQIFDEIKNAVMSRIDSTDLDGKTKEIIKKDIMQRLTESGIIEPYFSLGREGEHWLASNFTDSQGQKHFTVEAFKSTLERSKRKEEIMSMDPNARSDEYKQISDIDYRHAPANSFVNKTLHVMEVNKVPQDAIEEIMRLFISTLPETAMAKSFQRRSGREGYLDNSIQVFEKKIRNMAHQVARMKYNPKLNAIIDAMDLHTDLVGRGIKAGQIDALGNEVKEDIPARNNAEEKKYLDEFKKRINYIMNPTKNNLGDILQTAAFTYTMGFNVSSALVQTANIPMIIMPSLKAQYPNANITGAINSATKAFMSSGNTSKNSILGSKETINVKTMQSLDNYSPDSAFGKEFDVMLRTLNENGQLNRSQLNEILQGDIHGSAMQKFKAMSGWMLHHTERMNREVTMLATYNLEMDRLKKPTKADTEAIEDIKQQNAYRNDGAGISTAEATKMFATYNAINMNEMANGGLLAADSPRIAQNPIGKMFFMYKKFAVSTHYMLLKAFNDATKGESPEVRKAGWRQLGGIMGMTALMAGAQGIPLFGAFSMLWNLFTDDDDDDLKTTTRKALGEFFYKGPIEYMTNLSIASRISLSDLLIRDTQAGGSTSTFAQTALQALGGPVFGVEQNIERGLSKIANGHFERGIEDMLPSALANGFKAYRYATQGTETLRGDPITGDVNAFNVAGQLLGFAPANYIRQMEINDHEKGIDKALSDKQSKLKQRYYLAKREGDADGMLDIREELLKIGEKHPELGINGGTINKIISTSMKAQERATKEMIAGTRYSKKRLAEVKADIAEYDGE